MPLHLRLAVLAVSAAMSSSLAAGIAGLTVHDNSAGDYPTLVRDYGIALDAVNLGHDGAAVEVNGIAFLSAPGNSPAGPRWSVTGETTDDGLSHPGLDDLFFSQLSSSGDLVLTYTNLDPDRTYLVQFMHGEPRDCCATVYLGNILATDRDPAVTVPAISIGNGVAGENPPAASDLAIVSAELTGVTSFTYRARSGPGRDASLAGFQVREIDAPPVPTGAIPFLSEFVAVGNETHQDEDGDTPDWIEIYNPTGAALDLGGYHLTDDPGDLTKWTFPTTLLQAGNHLVVFASNKNRDTTGSTLHTNFRLLSEGEFLALVAPDGLTVLSEFAPGYPAQEPGFSYGTEGLAPNGTQGYFGRPTPGAANGILLTAPLLAPRIDPPCATFTSSTAVTITAAFPSGEIRYTTDGTAPTRSSRLYAGPLAINATTHLRARVFVAGTNNFGAIASGHYQRLATSASGGLPAPSDFTSNLPIMVVESLTGDIPGPGSVLQAARVTVHDLNPATGRSSLARPPDACFRIGIRRRGQSSSGFAKPQYRVELRDDNDVDLSYPLLGLPEESDWVFNGPWTDKALIRNPFAFALGRSIGIQAPRSKHFEMFLSTNGGTLTSDHYVGVYILLEKIKDDANRTDLVNLGPNDNTSPEVTGGYLLRFEPPGIADDGPRATNWSSVEILEPPAPTAAQQSWIGRYLDQFVATLNWRRGQGPNNSGVPNNDPLLGYPAFIDVDSFVSLFIINELLRSQDAYVRSDYMFKDRLGKLHKGPLWDFNLTAGTGCCFDNRNTSGWQYQQDYNRGGRDHGYEPDWFVPLMRCPDFRQRVIDRWAGLRADGILNPTRFDDLINSLANPLAEAAVRNFRKWDILGNGNVGFPTPVTNTWEEQITEMKRWLRLRSRWIDLQFPSPPILRTPSGSWPAGTALDVPINSSRPIYYTTDGSDPRLPGGGINPSASTLVASGTVSITATTALTVRTWSAGQDWSAPVSATYVIGTPADATNLLVTELNYHPTDPSADEVLADPTYRDDDFEFIELRNISAGPIDLSGARLVEGIEFTIPAPAVLPPGGFGLLVENRAAFEKRYGAGLPVLGVYANKLKNDGDTLRMLAVDGGEIFRFTFNDIWYPLTDGNGYTLVARDEEAVPASYSDPRAWAISCPPHGNPGAANGPLHTREFPGWMHDHFTAAERADLQLSGPGSDPDRDGLVTFMEFALRLDPRAPDAEGRLVGTIVSDNGQQYLALTFTRLQKAPGLLYQVEVSSDLRTWAPAGEPVGAPLDHGDGTESVTIRDNVPLDPALPVRFVRLKVEGTPVPGLGA